MTIPIAPDSIIPASSSKAECLGVEIPNLNKSLWDMFAAAAGKHPDEEALCSVWQASDHLNPQFKLGRGSSGTRTVAVVNNNEDEPVKPALSSAPLRWTYSQLLQKAESLAFWLQQNGCTKGGNLVVFVWNSAEWVLFLWVAARLRMPFVPLDPRSLETDAMHYLNLTHPEVLVVLNSDTLPTLKGLHKVKVRISLSDISNDEGNWHSLPQIMSRLSIGSSLFALPNEDSVAPGEELAMILFTSGTTSLPKGCPHTASNIWSATYDYDPVVRKDGQQHKWLIQTPVWHIFAVGQTIRGWRDGSSVVFPAEKFDVTASLRALQQQNITHVGAVPLLVKALVAHPEFPGKKSLSLLYVTMGGTLIKEEDVRFCKEHLGSEAVIQGFGMTEGSPMVSWRRDDPLLENGHHIGVGKVLPGARLKICSPKSNLPLEKGETGELHIGGTSVISGYLKGVDSGFFYEDEAGKWFVTGDQALIDKDDILYINGRYKDIIIRSGENLVPAKIENCLQDIGVIAQVVGIQDSVAGEVPVVVLQTCPQDVTKSSMVKAIVERLGPIYVPRSILTLENLQLSAFPMTATGKVRKVVLKAIVNRYSATISKAEGVSPNKQITDQLREIWAELMNSVPEDILLTDPVTDSADSITRLRFCKLLWGKFRHRLYLSDVERNKTIEQQAMLIIEQNAHGNSSTTLSGNMVLGERYGSLTVSSQTSWEESHSEQGGGDSILQNHENLTEPASKVMQKFGLTWENDVEDILTIKDTFQEFAKGQRPQSYRHRIAFKVKGFNPGLVRVALERSLLKRPILRTILVGDPGATAVHAVLRPSHVVYDILITQESFSHESEVQEALVDDFGERFEARMFKAIVADIGGNDTALIITLNHSVFDALFAYSWYSDLDMFIQNPDFVSAPTTPFKLFADTHQQYKNSSLALSDINFHIRRLRGISRFTEALWPLKRAPGWMIGTDEGSKDFIVRDRIRKRLSSNPQPRPRLVRIQDFPDIERLRSQHSIQASVVVKTAISLFNVIQTGQPYAIFKNFDAGRKWPFLPGWIADRLPSAMSINGPTLTWTMNMIQIKPTETCGELLTRMGRDQEELSSHAHAPWYQVLNGLGDDEGPIAKEASMRQVFNWDVSLKYLDSSVNDYKTLSLMGRMDWPDCGFLWNCGMSNTERFCCVVSWDDTQLDAEDINSYASKLLEIIGWISRFENWNNPVSMFQGFPKMT